MSVIKVDVDGVIRDIFTPMLDLYNREFNERLELSDMVSYDVNHIFPKVIERFGVTASHWFFDIHGNELFLESKTYAHVGDVLNRLRDMGHEVVIVTWQPLFSNKMNTLMFLEANGIQYDDICFTKEKWRIKGDYLIDDNPEFLLDKRDNSKKRIVMDFPYNRFISESAEMIRVNDIRDVLKCIN